MYTVYCTFIFSTLKALYTNSLKLQLTVKKKTENKKIKHTKAAKYSVSDSLPPFDLITYKIEPVTFNYVLIRFKFNKNNKFGEPFRQALINQACIKNAKSVN